MIQDVAEKQGNIDVDVVTEALAAQQTKNNKQTLHDSRNGRWRCLSFKGQYCITLDGTKIRSKYDIFDAIMNAREVQAKNLAMYL